MRKRTPDYPVGYGKPPLHSRFRKGTSGNPEGGRRHRTRLASVLQEALDQPTAGGRRRARRPSTRREAIVAGLVEKSAAGDLPATKLLLDLDLKTELATGPSPPYDSWDDPREILVRKLARLAAAAAAEEESGGGS
jgi:hypothetical protein